jgi:hypothetical protein
MRETDAPHQLNWPPQLPPRQVLAYDFAHPGPSPAAAGFSQLVWRRTRRVGFAVAEACSWAVYVCHFGWAAARC